jgi:hypothetical protein
MLGSDREERNRMNTDNPAIPVALEALKVAAQWESTMAYRTDMTRDAAVHLREALRISALAWQLEVTK